MPELPDLQVFSRNLDKALAGKKLKKLSILNGSKLKTPASTVKKSLEGERLDEVRRVGKELYFEFGKGKTLSLHLMLNGNLYLFEGSNERKNTIAEFLFDDDTGLALTDYQGMANLTLSPAEREAPDALSEEVDYNFLKEKFGTKRAAIKKLLLDQNFIRGIGNAYADEILWDAKISPFSVCNKIPDNKIKALTKSIKSVLKNGEKQILKVRPDAITGEVRDFLLIHNARKKESPTGASIRTEMVSSKKTYYTDEQELFE